MTNADLTMMILREIRDEIRKTNERLDSTNERLDGMTHRADATNERLDKVEGALLDLTQQQRFVDAAVSSARRASLRAPSSSTTST